jgi:hypothetical protein
MIISRISDKVSMRPLFIDFDIYTDGDAEFKKELIVLMIDNLMELQSTTRLAAQNNDSTLYLRVCHKVKATLEMLADVELLTTIDQLKVMMTDTARIALLERLCTDIIASLRQE